MKEIDDIGEVVIEDPDNGTTGQTLVVSGEIIGVKNIDTYWCCKSCNSKIELHTNLNFTTCSKCGLVQKKTKLAEKCVVHLLLELEDGSETIVTVFQNVLNTITGGGGPLRLRDTVARAATVCYTKVNSL